MIAPKLFKNFILLFGGNVLGQLFFFLGLIYLARIFGPAGFGIWNFGQAWMLYLLRAGELGVEVLAIREISRQTETTSHWITAVVSLRIILAIVLYGILIVFYWMDFFPPESSNLIMLFSLLIFPMAFGLEWVFEAHQKIGYVSFSRITKGIVFYVLVLLFVKSSEHMYRSAILYILSITVPFIVIFITAKIHFGFGKLSSSIKNGLHIIKNALPIGIATILSQYSLFFGTIIVGYWLKDVELGFYTAGHRLVIFLWAYGIVSSNRILLPTLSRYYHTSMEDFSNFIQKFFRLTILAALPIGLMMVVSAKDMILFLYTSQYQSSVIVFQILMVALVAAISRSIFEIGFIASNHQKKYFYLTLSIAIAYTVFTILLTRWYGIIGAASASLIVEALSLVYVLITFQYVKFSILYRYLWKPVTAITISIVGVVLFNGFHFIFRIAVGCIVYAGMLMVMKGVSNDDLRWLRRIFSKEPNEVLV